VIEGEAIVPGAAEALLLVLDAPLSLWGGLDPRTGTVVDVRHPQHGHTIAGRILVMPGGRGSSSSSTILAEAVRLGTSPAAIVLCVADPVLVAGAIVAERLYDKAVPIVRVESLAGLETGLRARVRANGRIEILAG
jgi:predicted aconitase with swiveling domain